ncbi:MAG: hypothetical protein AAGK37_19340 [Pseudomonadota bacterium]
MTPGIHSYVLGIDPGITGALAWVHLETKRLVQIAEMPTLLLPGGKKKIVDAPTAHRVISTGPLLERVAIEAVHASPRMGNVSAFSFGRSLGLIEAAAQVVCRDVIRVSPKDWQSALNLTGGDKEKHRERAQKLWPEHSDLFSKAKDDGAADAALIAYVTACRFSGQNVRM